MKNLPFWKFQGAGNDFILVDQRHEKWLYRGDQALIEKLCDRRFGIGADGLMLLENCPGYDFEMIYFNADGRESSMCGNGGRCIAAFAHQLGIIAEKGYFLAIDGPHEALVFLRQPAHYQVELRMSDVLQIERHGNDFVLNTGSPHFVRFAPDTHILDMVAEGRKIRYSEQFAQEGINVNLVSPQNGHLDIRTYERGVEDETLACGTGVTAAALAWHQQQAAPTPGHQEVQVQARGGQLQVRFEAQHDGTYRHIWLCGPAIAVFSGQTDLNALFYTQPTQA
jgi:diaminopimelate epimerase